MKNNEIITPAGQTRDIGLTMVALELKELSLQLEEDNLRLQLENLKKQQEVTAIEHLLRQKQEEINNQNKQYP